MQGDFVEVVDGPNLGAQGFVIDASSLAIVIYTRTVAVLYAKNTHTTSIEQEGHEVSDFSLLMIPLQLLTYFSDTCQPIAPGLEGAFRFRQCVHLKRDTAPFLGFRGHTLRPSPNQGPSRRFRAACTEVA